MSWHPDPEAVSTDAMILNWASIQGYAFPPFAMISSVLQKTTQEQADLTLVAPVASATLVANPPAHACENTNATPECEAPSQGPIIPRENPSNVSEIAPSRVSHIRKNHETAGIPGKVTKILLSSTRSSTHKTYQSA